MNIIKQTIALSVLLTVFTLALQAAEVIKPNIGQPLRDPSICRGPDNTYYLVGTTPLAEVDPSNAKAAQVSQGAPLDSAYMNCRGGQLKELRLPMLLSGGPFPLSLQVAVLTDPNWSLDETKRYGRNNPPPKPESRVIGTLDIAEAAGRELVLKLPTDLAQQVNDQGSIAFEITDPRGEQGGSTFLTSSRGETSPRLIVDTP